MVRDRADYSYDNVSKSEAYQQLRKAEEMIGLIGKELEK